jgi:predicted phage tail protein
MKTRIALAALLVLGASLAGCMGESLSPIDIAPPAAPQGLTLVQGASGAMLEWQANTEPDLAGYQVYRASLSVGETSAATQLTASAITDVEYPIEMVQGNWQYSVRAVDARGHLSAPATVSINLQSQTSDSDPTEEGVRTGRRGN